MRISILPQPDDETCGPTSLHAIYNYYGLNLSLEEVINSVHFLKEGGTLAVFLGIDALKRGFNCTLYSYNLRVFDPSWKKLKNEQLIEKLKLQLEYKKKVKIKQATKAYIEYLQLGGTIKFDLLSVDLLKKHLQKGSPILAGLSATYLYDCKREFVDTDGSIHYDDLKGEPTGHFVVVGGINENNKVLVSDPYLKNPISSSNYYEVKARKIINSIFLGILTYDANILIIKPNA
jgi:hypothetical protein